MMENKHKLKIKEILEIKKNNQVTKIITYDFENR